MTTLTEGKLQITVVGAISARKFDGDCHGLSHCMKAVDFIVELDDHYLFIEFKDPQNPEALAKTRDKSIESFKSGKLDEDFKHKYRDSFLYEWMSGRADKPIDYFILYAMETLDGTHLTRRTDALKGKLPLQGPGGLVWCRPIVRSCGVFNIDTWNKYLPNYPVTRILA